MATKCVCVWLDETDTDGMGWVVSVDEIENGDTEHTATVSVHATEEEAVEAAKAQGADRQLPVYRFESATDGYGRGNRHTLIAETVEK